MTQLTDAILSHDHDGIESAIIANPAVITERSKSGLLPIELAERTGNVVTLVRTARLIKYDFSQRVAEEHLKKYTALVASTDCEPIPSVEAAEMIWERVFNGASFKVDRWQRPLISLQSQAEDIRYLILRSEILTLEQFKAWAKNA
jgi:hypothetical protein